jgi:hypothetical protein
MVDQHELEPSVTVTAVSAVTAVTAVTVVDQHELEPRETHPKPIKPHVIRRASR